MNAAKCLAALALMLPLGGAAEAKSFAWCQVNAGKYQAYLSGIVEIDDGPAAFHALAAGPFASGFRQYVQSLAEHTSAPECTSQESMFFAHDYIDVLIAGNPGYKFVKTGWRGSQKMTAAASPSQHGSGTDSREGALRYRK